MPGQYLPDNEGAVIADLQNRVRRLETFQQGIVLQQQSPLAGGGPFAYASTFTNFRASSEISLPRPQTIIVFPTVSAYYGSGGTASFMTVRCIICPFPLTVATPSNDVNGNPMQGPQSYQTNGSGVQNHAGPFSNPCPAGNWVAVLQYVMQGGATTKFSYTKAEIDVFTIG